MTEISKFGLTGNPFDIHSHRHDMADRKEEWDRIVTLLNSAFNGTIPRYFVIQGDYGEGKSYMLDQIFFWLSGESKPQDQVFVVRGVLLDKPLAIMKSEPRFSKMGLNFVSSVFSNIKRERLTEVLKKADLSNFTSPFLKVFEGISEDEEAAFMFITGEPLSASERKSLGVREALKDSPKSLELFYDFLRVINLAGYTSFLLLLDELEYIAAVLSESKITQFLNTFREIFDNFGYYDDRYPGKIARPIFVFAVSPGGWERLEELSETARKKTGGGGIAPFMERISKRDMMLLHPFGLEDSMELIKLRLSEVRTEEAIKDPLFPFTKECVEFVHANSFNKPRNMIQYCGILLEDALEEGLDKVDQNDAKRILRKYGIVSQQSNIEEEF